jgi:HK97 family phage portal protein
MGLWSRLFGQKTNSQSRFWLDLLDGGKTKAGVNVTTGTAMRTAAVWACVTVRSEDIAKLPVHLYRRRKDGGKDRATEHPAYRLMHDQANYRNTAFEFKQMMQMQVDLHGNALAVKELDARGQIAALWPIQWTNVQILKSKDERDLFYRVMIGNEQIIIPAEDVFHLRGNTLDGVCGLSPIAWQRETIGLAMAQDTYAGAFFGNSAQPNGALISPEKLSKEAADALRTSWEARFRGPENSNKLAIFDGGMDWRQIGMNNADAQFIEARKYQNAEIWRIFRVPPHKVGDLEKATFSNIEMQALEYVQDCLMSIMERWQQALARDILSEKDRTEYFFEFMPDAILKGDILSRYGAYQIGLMNGWLSDNDIRDRENMNRIEDGDQYFRSMNLQPLDMPQMPPPEKPAPTKPKRKADGKDQLISRLKAELDSAYQRSNAI